MLRQIAKKLAVVAVDEAATLLRERLTEKPGTSPAAPPSFRPRPDATRQTVRFQDIYPNEGPRAQKDWL